MRDIKLIREKLQLLALTHKSQVLTSYLDKAH